MTPQERSMISDLFSRLASLERSPRDAEAERAIYEGLKRAPNAVYALVQTVLVQDEALKLADQRIRELENIAGDADTSRRGDEPGFLDNIRDNLFGREQPRGSVPRTGDRTAMGVPRGFGSGRRMDRDDEPAGGSPWSRQGMQAGAAMGGRGSSFLGTAAAAAAGMIGGSLLLESVRGMLGSHAGGPAAGAFDKLAGKETGGGSGAGDELGREAGAGDIGRDQQTGLMDEQGGWDRASADGGDFSGDDFGGGFDSDIG
jgi:hypothetical protein